MSAIITKAPDRQRQEGRDAYAIHGELGEYECPYPVGPESGGRRTWWFEGFYAARTEARLKARGVMVEVV